jgi:SNF family Na+-dependent transporter
MGCILTYASYLSHGDDIALSGLTAASTNELAEVIFGGSIVIPLAFAFLGPLGTGAAANSGAFNLGFITMPLIFGKIPLGELFAFLWFALLFLAGITSSVSLMQPAVAFMKDDFKLDHKKAMWLLGIAAFVLCQAPIFFLAQGVVDELDFWAGTFCLTLFAAIETVLFVWVFGIERAWEEIHHGAELKIPAFYKFIIKYITPLLLFFILGFWIIQQGIPILFMHGVPAQNVPYIIATRIGLIALFLAIAVSIKIIWQGKKLS